MALLVADQTLHLYVHTCDTKKIPYSRVAALKNQISSAIEMKKKNDPTESIKFAYILFGKLI